ncbi:MAG: hypothetical protein AAF713_12770 [Pseudomonadota bacterium]
MSRVREEIGPIDRIVFTSDWLRVTDLRHARYPNPQRTNIAWTAHLFAPIFESILGCPSVQIALDEESLTLDRYELYRMHGVDFSTQGWAYLYNKELSEEAEAALAPLFERAFVVAYEMPPYMRAMFARHGVPYLDLTIHPVRFMEDYLLAMRSSVPALRQALVAHFVPDRAIARQVRLIRALAERRLQTEPDPPDGSAVFIGQMAIDAALIIGDRHATQQDAEDAIVDMLRRHSRLYYKPHPHLRDTGWIDALVDSEPGLILTDVNVYDLLGSGRVTEIGGLSSSVLFEAGHFGVAARRYLDNGHHLTGAGEVPGPDQFAPVLPRVLEESVWGAAFAGAEWVADPDGLQLRDAAIKGTLNMTWGR